VSGGALGLAARGRAALAYLVSGIEGVNRVLRHTSKAGVVPVLRMFDARIGPGCDIEAPLLLHNAQQRYANLDVGPLCHIGKDVFIDLAARVTLGERVTLSMRATILTHTDAGQSPLTASALPASRGAVTIDRGAYVGAGAIVLAGVHVGECAVIGAGAVVTRSVAPRAVVAGSPARPLRDIPASAIET
jgi:acetyltransferase-like isoleucine patch superfamily enzyme